MERMGNEGPRPRDIEETEYFTNSDFFVNPMIMRPRDNTRLINAVQLDGRVSRSVAPDLRATAPSAPTPPTETTF